MLTTIGITLAVLIAVILGYAATRPDRFRIERRGTIKAAPEKIFPYLNDFHKGAAWSPYEHKDPAMMRVYSGAPSGKGAVYEFVGNKDIGTGRLEIVESAPLSKVVISLDMRKPVEAHNIVEYTLEPKGNVTEFTWAIHGPVPFIGKVMSLFFSMDKMIGKDFEEGIANLKAVTEQENERGVPLSSEKNIEHGTRKEAA